MGEMFFFYKIQLKLSLFKLTKKNYGTNYDSWGRGS